MENFQIHYFMGDGPLMASARNADGSPVGFGFMGDIGECTISPSSETQDMIEHVSGTRSVGSSVTTGNTFDLSLTMRSIKPDHLQKMLKGGHEIITSGSETSQPHTASLGSFIALEHGKVSSVDVTGSGGSPTYVVDTDYKVHADIGMIEILSGGSITEGLAIEVDYDYAAQQAVNAQPNDDSLMLYFAGRNLARDSKMNRVEMYKVKLNIGSPDLITEQQAEASLTGKIELDTTRAAGNQLFRWLIED